MYCRNCGAKVEERSKFCKMCGTPVNSTDDKSVGTAPVQSPVNNGSAVSVKNKYVLPLPVYIIGLIINGFNLFLDIGAFLLCLWCVVVNSATGASELVLSIVGSVFTLIALILAFVAILMGILNRAKPKKGVSEDKFVHAIAFIILTFICIIVTIIGLYLLGGSMWSV